MSSGYSNGNGYIFNRNNYDMELFTFLVTGDTRKGKTAPNQICKCFKYYGGQFQPAIVIYCGTHLLTAIWLAHKVFSCRHKANVNILGNNSFG